MLQKEIKEGSTYTIVHGNPPRLEEVKVLKIRTIPTRYNTDRWAITRTRPKHTSYICLKLSTGREIYVKSAAKFRNEA